MSPVPVLIAAHVCSMLGYAIYAALLPQLRDGWGLSNAQAGIVGGMFFGGYVVTVSFWTGLTDRGDARRVYAAASLVAAAGSAGFGWLAQGFFSASFFQALLGAGIAGTYMPGLRLLSDRVSGPGQSRPISFYTASFGIGTALSLALGGAVAGQAGWRAAFLAAAVGPLVAGALVLAFIAPLPQAPSPARSVVPFLSWGPILRHRESMGYIVGYAVHCLELFGSRSWMVAFLTFSALLQPPDRGFPWSPQNIAATVNLAAVAASIGGNEAALRVGRRRWILLAMAASGAFGILLGSSARWPWTVVVVLLIVYSMLVMAESATLTAGLVAAAPPELRGAAMGLYSLVGFGGGMIGPVIYGAALDAAGGARNPLAWVAAYAAIGSGCLLAPIAARWFGGQRLPE
ncbi:MAG TPA: MFS transporter [Myxococcales bacterium]|nr:MFS transporter [Myxococcales bacterium]